jgi:hypothetical protein
MKGKRMKSFRISLLVMLCVFVMLSLTQTAFASDLPDLPKQELWVKIVSMLVGLVVIFSLCVLGLNRILYSTMALDANNSTKISIVVGIILSYLWFLYLFGQIFDTMLTIAMGVLAFVILVVIFIRGRSDSYQDE